MKRLGIGIAAVAVLLSGCGQDASPGKAEQTTAAAAEAVEEPAIEEPSEEAAVEELDEQEPVDTGLPSWEASSGKNAWVCIDDAQGITYWVDVPPAQDGEFVKEIEAARQRAGVDGEVTYIPVEVDATAAVESPVPARELKWATTGQETQIGRTVDDVTDEWGAGEYPDYLVDVSNKSLELAAPARGAKGEQVFVVDGAVESIVGLTLTTSWYDDLVCHLEEA